MPGHPLFFASMEDRRASRPPGGDPIPLPPAAWAVMIPRKRQRRPVRTAGNGISDFSHPIIFRPVSHGAVGRLRQRRRHPNESPRRRVKRGKGRPQREIEPFILRPLGPAKHGQRIHRLPTSDSTNKPRWFFRCWRICPGSPGRSGKMGPRFCFGIFPGETRQIFSLPCRFLCR